MDTNTMQYTTETIAPDQIKIDTNLSRAFPHPAGTIKEMAESLVTAGQAQPIIVEPDPKEDGMYRIIAGTRRVQGAEYANSQGLTNGTPLMLTANVYRGLTDQDRVRLATSSNTGSPMSPIDKAHSYKAMRDQGLTLEEVGSVMGAKKSYVSVVLRALDLPKKVQKHIHDGKGSVDAAVMILAVEDEEDRKKQFEEFVTDGISQTEAKARRASKAAKDAEEGGRVKRKQRTLKQVLQALRDLAFVVGSDEEGADKKTLPRTKVNVVADILLDYSVSKFGENKLADKLAEVIPGNYKEKEKD